MVTVKDQNNQTQDLPFTRSFSGHETFPFRFSWLKKGVDFLVKEQEVFQNEDAVVKFGIATGGRSITYYQQNFILVSVRDN